jgi:hypothetical protein
MDLTVPAATQEVVSSVKLLLANIAPLVKNNWIIVHGDDRQTFDLVFLQT